MTEYRRSTESFAIATENGVPYVVAAGDVSESDDPIVTARPDLFAAPEDGVVPISESSTIATAATFRPDLEDDSRPSDGMTVPELRSELEELGVDVAPKAKRDVLAAAYDREMTDG